MKIITYFQTLDWDKLVPKIIALSLVVIAIVLIIMAIRMPINPARQPREKKWFED